MFAFESRIRIEAGLTLFFLYRIIVFSVLINILELEMDFAANKNRISHIVAKYKCFITSLLSYNVIHRTFDEIRTDLSAAFSIRTFLITNFGKQECSALLPLVQQTINQLEMIATAVRERIDQLEAIKNSLDADECNVDDILQWMMV